MHPDPDLAALRAAGWHVETAPGPTGRPYFRAWRGGWQRGSYRPESLREMCEEAPREARGAVVQLRLWKDAA